MNSDHLTKEQDQIITRLENRNIGKFERRSLLNELQESLKKTNKPKRWCKEDLRDFINNFNYYIVPSIFRLETEMSLIISGLSLYAKGIAKQIGLDTKDLDEMIDYILEEEVFSGTMDVYEHFEREKANKKGETNESK